MKYETIQDYIENFGILFGNSTPQFDVLKASNNRLYNFFKDIITQDGSVYNEDFDFFVETLAGLFGIQKNKIKTFKDSLTNNIDNCINVMVNAERFCNIMENLDTKLNKNIGKHLDEFDIKLNFPIEKLYKIITDIKEYIKLTIYSQSYNLYTLRELILRNDDENIPFFKSDMYIARENDKQKLSAVEYWNMKSAHRYLIKRLLNDYDRIVVRRFYKDTYDNNYDGLYGAVSRGDKEELFETLYSQAFDMSIEHDNSYDVDDLDI